MEDAPLDVLPASSSLANSAFGSLLLLVVLVEVGDKGFGRQQQSRDARGIAQAVRTTLTGSMMPDLTMSTYSLAFAS
jgi:hypothetical protein